MIPVEAVEAAHEAWLAHKATRSPDNAKDAIREALEAAAPYIRAQALGDAAEAAGDPSPEDMDEYFLDQSDAGRWLRARAAAERGGE